MNKNTLIYTTETVFQELYESLTAGSEITSFLS